LEQAQMLLLASRDSRLHAYVVLSVMTGLRTEELRALRWSEVDLDAGAVAVYRAARVTGDTKTRKSRRVLGLPQLAVQALREHHKPQAADRLKAGALWHDHGLVFASSIGTPLDRHNVLREFRKMPLEDIADLVGHKGTLTTETACRKVIVPELRRGAEVMDRLFT
jgi:integrase